MSPEELLAQQTAAVERAKAIAERAVRDFDIEKVKLDAMRRMWAAATSPPPSAPSHTPNEAQTSIERRSGGRQPGAITKQWRDTLARLYGVSGVRYADIHDAYQKATNAEITPSGVRDRVRKLVVMGWMDGNPTDGFEVTEAAAARYGFTKKEGPAGTGPSQGVSFETLFEGEGGTAPNFDNDEKQF